MLGTAAEVESERRSLPTAIAPPSMPSTLLFLFLHTVAAFKNTGILQKPVDKFCRGTNEFMRATVFPNILDVVDIRPAASATEQRTYIQKALSPPDGTSTTVHSELPPLLRLITTFEPSGKGS